jgi:hypothetical protein
METQFQKICFISGGIITLCFGIWHLFVPTIHRWFFYIPDTPLELKNAITATNFFLSLSLILFGVLSLSSYYYFRTNVSLMKLVCLLLVFLWTARLIYQIFIPQGLIIPYLRYYLLIIFIIPLACFAIPLISLWHKT